MKSFPINKGGASSDDVVSIAQGLDTLAVNFQANLGIFAGLTTITAGTQFISNMPGRKQQH